MTTRLVRLRKLLAPGMWRHATAGLLAIILAAAGAQPSWATLSDPAGPPRDAPDLVRGALVELLGPLQEALRTTYPDTFAGLWIDDNGMPHVAVTGTRDEIGKLVDDAAIRPAPAIESVRFSERYLAAVMDSISSTLTVREDGGALLLAGVEVTSIRESLQDNAIIVGLVDDTPTNRASLVSGFGDAVRIEVDPERFEAMCSRTSCGSPLKAGLQLYRTTSGTKACMSAFIMQDLTIPPRYSITSAGHCWTSNTLNRYHPKTYYIGNTQGQYHPVSTPVDAMNIPIAASQASNLVYSTSSLFRPVTAVENFGAEIVGEQVCSSKLSGVDCGYLQSKNVCTEYGVCGQRLASYQYTCPGDSGSPVYVVIGTGPNARAMGIMVAGTAGSNPCPNGTTGGHQGIYTHMRNVEAAFGLLTTTSAP